MDRVGHDEDHEDGRDEVFHEEVHGEDRDEVFHEEVHVEDREGQLAEICMFRPGRCAEDTLP